MTFMLRFAELPSSLRIAYVFSLLLIILHVFIIAALLYWQLVEPKDLTFKYWFKAPLHLDVFESAATAAIIGAFFLVVQLIGLFLYTSWMFQSGKKIYYLVFGMIIVGIWTYFLVPAILLLAFMLPEVSLHHFGVLSFEDLF